MDGWTARPHLTSFRLVGRFGRFGRVCGVFWVAFSVLGLSWIGGVGASRSSLGRLGDFCWCWAVFSSPRGWAFGPVLTPPSSSFFDGFASSFLMMFWFRVFVDLIEEFCFEFLFRVFVFFHRSFSI